MRKHLISLLAGMTLLASPVLAFDGPELYPGERGLLDQAAKDGLVIASNVALGWANWTSVVKGFSDRYPELMLVHNDIGSISAVILLDRQREKPAADTVYLTGFNALDASTRGVLQPFRPFNVDRLPTGLKDKDGFWTTVHQMPIAFLVNRKLVKNIPRSWADLRKPDYKNQITYFDPINTTVGLMTAFAANVAAGSTLDSVRPAIDYFSHLHRIGNIQRVDTANSYARFLKGEIPIWINYEAEGLRAKYADGFDDVEIVLPSDGTASAAYVMSLVKGARNDAGGKLWFNYVMSDQAQRLFAEGFARPVLPGLILPSELANRFAPMPKTEMIDQLQAVLRKPDIDRLWPKN